MLDISQFLYRNFEEARPYGNPANDIEIHCPFCGDDKYHMKIGIARVQAVHCFRCSYGGGYIKFVMDYLGISYYKALGELYVKPSLNKLLRKKAHEKPNHIQIANLPKDYTLLYDMMDTGWTHVVMSYLKKRGFTERYWLRYKLGLADSIPGRIIIPIENGYWQARAVAPWLEPKYINPKAEAREVIFNFIALQVYDEVVVCEGAFSAMAIGENAVALIGKEPTDEKCERIIASPAERIVIALEPGAYGSMGVLMQRLTKSGKQVIVWKYSVGDPADPAGVFIEMEYDLKTRLSLEIVE